MRAHINDNSADRLRLPAVGADWWRAYIRWVLIVGGIPLGRVHIGGSLWGPFGAPADPPRRVPPGTLPGPPSPGGPGAPPRGARGAHFGGYLITLPVGTEWDIFAGPHFWPKSGFLPPWDRIPPSNTKRSYLDPQNDPLRGVPRGVPGGPPARGGSPPGARIFRAPRGPPGGAPGGPREGPFGGVPGYPPNRPPRTPHKGGL